jgi:hypothetical protein
LIAVGLILLAASMIWPRVVSSQSLWSEEQALEKSSAAADLHRKSHVAAHAQISTRLSAEDKARKARELKEAQQRFDESRRLLDEAQTVRRTIPMILRWTGSVLAVIGVVSYFSIRGAEPRRGRR